MKRNLISGLFRNNKWIKYTFLPLFLAITFSFSSIHKANADIEFKAKAEYVNQYLQEKNIDSQTQTEINNYLNGEDYDLTYTKSTIANSGNKVLDTLYSFSIEALQKDQNNFFKIKNQNILTVDNNIENLRTKLKSEKTLTSDDDDFITKLKYIYDSSRYFFNTTNNTDQGYVDIFNTFKDSNNSFSYYSQFGNATNGEDDIYSSLDNNSDNDVQNVILREWRVYLYNAITKLKQDYTSKNINQEILDFVGDKDNGILHDVYDANGTADINEKLTDGEISGNKAIIGGIDFKVNTTVNPQTGVSTPIIDADTGTVQQDLSKINSCDPGLPFMDFGILGPKDSIVSNPNCSVVAYLINGLFSLLNGFAALILSLVISLFNWVINFGVTNFKDLLDGSGAYLIYRDVILALVTSLLLPLIFYLIIRMLIDNDTEKIQKMIPKILLTALFVYFSFNVAGWIIDQANIFTLWIYNTLSSSSAQGISGAMSNILFGGGGQATFTTAVDVAKGDPSSIPVYLVQLVISLTSILVFAQAIVLFFLRAIILLLCLIFSPIMVLPSGINSKIDEYKKMVTDKYVNNLILAPVFMFLVLIALEIGAAGQNIMKSVSSSLPTLPNAPTLSSGENFLGAAIAGIISIIVLMIAISVAKKMSGDIGGKISAKISSLSGNLAFGAISGGSRAVAGKMVNNGTVDKWIEKGGTGSRQLFNLKNRVNSSTFDVRNNGAVRNLTKGKLGQGSTMTNDRAFNQKFQKRREYHNALNSEGKERHLEGLENSRSHDKKEIAKKLRNNEGLSFGAKLQTNKQFNQKFDKANNQTNLQERTEDIYKNIDKHFADNGKGSDYFTKQMQDPKNAKTKEALDKALKNTDPKKRKQEISDIVEQFEKSQPKNQPNKTSQPVNTATNNPQTTPAGPQNNQGSNSSSNQNNQRTNGPAPSVKNAASQQALKENILQRNGGQAATAAKLQNMRATQNTIKQNQKTVVAAANQKSVQDYQAQVLAEAAKKNAHTAKDVGVARERIKNIDTQLKNIDTKLNSKTLSKSESGDLEKVYNSLNQEKKGLQEKFGDYLNNSKNKPAYAPPAPTEKNVANQNSLKYKLQKNQADRERQANAKAYAEALTKSLAPLIKAVKSNPSNTPQNITPGGGENQTGNASSASNSTGIPRSNSDSGYTYTYKPNDFQPKDSPSTGEDKK